MILKQTFLKLVLTGICITLVYNLMGQDTTQVTYLSKHPANDRYGRYSPNGKMIAFESDRNGNWDIFLLDKKSGNQIQITTDTFNDRWPSWHPSGEKILFVSNKSGINRLYELEINGRRVKKIDLGKDFGEIHYAAYSPNGKTIAFSVQEADTQFNLYLFDLETKQSQALTKGTFRTLFPDWAPNGKELVFFSRKDTNNEDDEIYRMNIKNGRTKRLTNWPQNNFCPNWSNKGDRIAYVTSMESSRPEIYIMRKNGKYPLRITYNETGDTLPSWSPDDKYLLITTFYEGHYEIAEITIP